MGMGVGMCLCVGVNENFVCVRRVWSAGIEAWEQVGKPAGVKLWLTETDSAYQPVNFSKPGNEGPILNRFLNGFWCVCYMLSSECGNTLVCELPVVHMCVHDACVCPSLCVLCVYVCACCLQLT